MITHTETFALAVTLGCYELAGWLFRRSGRRAVFNPLLLAVILVVPCLKLARVEYDVYFSGARFIHYLLGPATVALAVPLYEQRDRVRAALLPLAGATLAGATVSIAITVATLTAGGSGRLTVVSFAPRSVTTPVAMAVSERLGGSLPLTAGGVLMTGVFGSVTALGVLKIAAPVIGRRSRAAEGFALGMCAHGAGTARAFQEGNEAGSFAGLAIGLHALASAVLVPVAIRAMGL